MLIRLILLVAFGLLTFPGAASTAFDAPDWENHQVLSINREPARASFYPFASI